MDIRRRWDHLRLAEDVFTQYSTIFQPFDYWIGDWKPLYTVTDYDYFRSEGFRLGWPSWERKYGWYTRRTNPSDDTGGFHTIWPHGESKTFYVRQRIVKLMNEFIDRLP